MAKIKLKPGANIDIVADELRQIGITLNQRLPDGSYVAYINQNRWLCMQYPELEPLLKEERAFWKNIRKRTRNGENIQMSEIEEQAKAFNEQFNKIISEHERKEQKTDQRCLD